MADEAKQWWETHGRQFQQEAQLPVEVLYGPGGANEEKLQIIGSVAGKRVLEIGCGGAQCGIAFAKQGAIVSGVDIAASQIDFAQELAAQHGVTITFYQRDMTDLTTIASDSEDLVFSAMAFQYVDDLLSCFREAYRVLKIGGRFVWSVGHPCSILDPQTWRPTRSYFDTGKVVSGADVSQEIGFAFAENFRTVSDYFNTLIEAGFTVERMIEPDMRPFDRDDPKNRQWGQTPEFLDLFPSTLIFQGVKREAASREKALP